MSTNNDLILQDFTATSFLGISSDSPVVLDFTNHKFKGVTILKGDQGVGKTSTLTALMLMMGAAFEIEMKNFNNLKDETTKLDLPFVYQGTNYHATLSAGRLTLKKQYKEANGKWMAEGSPKEMLRLIFGTLGVSPMFLKSMEGKKQIEWFKKTFGKDEDASRKELNKIKELKEVTEQRKETNREIKALKGWLDVNDLYNNYEASLKKFEKPVNATAEKKRFDELSNKKDLYNQYVNTQDSKRATLRDQQNDIADLEKKLAEAKEIELALKESIEKGDQWLVDNKSIPADFEKANKEWLNLSTKMSEEKTWKEVLAKEKEYNAKLADNIQENDKIDKLRTDLLKITKSYLPEIPGLEVRVKVSLDDEDEGLYYQNKTLAQLSESELWDLFIKIWEDNDVRFIFCENVQDLGSDAVKTMNRLVKEKKVRIFGSEMDRDQKEMQVTFAAKVE